jgi:hypothetical protein
MTRLHHPEHFDAADIAQAESMGAIPDGALVTGYIAMYQYIHPDTGASCFHMHQAINASYTSAIGLLAIGQDRLLRELHAANGLE